MQKQKEKETRVARPGRPRGRVGGIVLQSSIKSVGRSGTLGLLDASESVVPVAARKKISILLACGNTGLCVCVYIHVVVVVVCLSIYRRYVCMSYTLLKVDLPF